MLAVGDFVEAIVAILVLIGSAIAGGKKMLKDHREEEIAGGTPPERRSPQVPVPPNVVRPATPRQAPLAQQAPAMTPQRAERKPRRAVEPLTAASPGVGVPSLRSRPSQTEPLVEAHERARASPPKPPTHATPKPIDSGLPVEAFRRLNRGALRRAVLLNEILSPPLSIRGEQGEI